MLDLLSKVLQILLLAAIITRPCIVATVLTTWRSRRVETTGLGCSTTERGRVVKVLTTTAIAAALVATTATMATLPVIAMVVALVIVIVVKAVPSSLIEARLIIVMMVAATMVLIPTISTAEIPHSTALVVVARPLVIVMMTTLAPRSTLILPVLGNSFIESRWRPATTTTVAATTPLSFPFV